MVKGEYESMLALWNLSPDFVPRPIGHGTYQSDPNSHFFLCDFIDMADELPDVVDFCEKLADLHRRSIAIGPEDHDGQFGFHVTTYNGKLPQDNTWNESWEAFYIGGIKHMFALEESVHGPSPEIEALLPALCEKVIPRLLRPLETEGRTLKPCLVHGDLWDGNAAVHAETDQPYIFDSSAFWAHNECIGASSFPVLRSATKRCP
jgi:protein-ribulosamine 3-kinase